MTRVMLIDADMLARRRLRRTLEHGGDVRVVSESISTAEAVAALKSAPADVLLASLTTPDVADIGSPATENGPLAQLPRVLLIPSGSLRDPLDFDRNTALGFVASESASTDVAHAVRQAAAGKRYVSAILLPQVSIFSADAPSQTALSDPIVLLTPREREVFDLLDQGKDFQEIAVVLGRSTATIRTHHTHILNKLQLRNDFQLGWFLQQRADAGRDACPR